MRDFSEEEVEKNDDSKKNNVEKQADRRDDKAFKELMIKIADENDDIFKGLVDK